MRLLLVVVVLSVAAPAFAEDLVGTWNVVMKANYSTCSDARVGDEKSEVWNVSKSGPAMLDVHVTGGAGTTTRYVGARTPDGTVRLHNVTSGESKEVRIGAEVGVELLPAAAGELRGRRIVASLVGHPPQYPTVPPYQPTTCAIVYDVTAKRQR